MSTGAFELRSRFRALTDHTVTVLAVLATILVIVPLAVIFAELIYKGVSSLNWDFFTKVPAPEGESGGGMANAIVGSAVLLGLAASSAFPSASAAAFISPSLAVAPNWPMLCASRPTSSTAFPPSSWA